MSMRSQINMASASERNRFNLEVLERGIIFSPYRPLAPVIPGHSFFLRWLIGFPAIGWVENNRTVATGSRSILSFTTYQRHGIERKKLAKTPIKATYFRTLMFLNSCGPYIALISMENRSPVPTSPEIAASPGPTE